jgi:carboxymethylenebutenolidase
MDDPETSIDGLSRRDAMRLTVAAGLTAATGKVAAAADPAPTQRAVDIKTPGGTCDAVLVHAGARPSPAVILYPDAMGLRPVKIDMAKRLAAQGYTVLVVNQFYRVRRAPVHPPGFSFTNPDDRARLMKMMAALDHQAVTSDAAAFIAFLDTRPEANAKSKLGAVGFCMGGSMTIRAAAAVPARVGACASFHGGNLVTDDPNSPHRLVGRTQASYHIGIAADDDAKEPNAKIAMAEALNTANRPRTIEVYPGTKHGWTVPDSQVYDPIQAERAWTAMLSLYKKALV